MIVCNYCQSEIGFYHSQHFDALSVVSIILNINDVDNGKWRQYRDDNFESIPCKHNNAIYLRLQWWRQLDVWCQLALVLFAAKKLNLQKPNSNLFRIHFSIFVPCAVLRSLKQAKNTWAVSLIRILRVMLPSKHPPWETLWMWRWRVAIFVLPGILTYPFKSNKPYLEY